MNSLASTLIGLALVLGVGGIVYWQTGSAKPLPAETGNENEGTTGGAEGITMDTLAQHASRESCWTAINGNVYDLTSWVPKHPGGEQAILQLCGTDGSAKFNGQHGGDSAKESILAGFRVDVLAR
jgi:hypothetical protein